MNFEVLLACKLIKSPLNVDVAFAPRYVPAELPATSAVFVRLRSACVVEGLIDAPIESASTGAIVPTPILPMVPTLPPESILNFIVPLT